jgi:hypothetical protein
MRRRFGAFVVERFPLVLTTALGVFDRLGIGALETELSIDGARPAFRDALRHALFDTPTDLDDPTPGVPPARRMAAAIQEAVDACDGFLRRAALRASLTADAGWCSPAPPTIA